MGWRGIVIHVDPKSHQTNAMEMERADGRGFEKSKATQKQQNSGLQATVKNQKNVH